MFSQLIMDNCQLIVRRRDCYGLRPRDDKSYNISPNIAP